MRRSVAALATGAAILIPELAVAETRNADCSITHKGETDEGPCRFIPDVAGSFTIGMGVPGSGRGVWVQIADGAATVSGAGPGKSPTEWGMAVRDAADRACWAGTDFRVYARTVDKATSKSRPADTPKLPEGRVQFIGRCHMDACTWL